MLQNLVNIKLTLWPVADKRHVSYYNIPQLRQFIEMMVTQKLTYTGHPMIILMLIQCRPVFLGIYSHTPKLIYHEGTTETPNAFLLENSRASILSLHRNITYQEQRRKHQ